MGGTNLFEVLGMDLRLTALNKRIPKKQLYIHGELSAAERELITERIEGMRMMYVLNVHTFPMEEVKNEQEQYDLILFAEVRLKAQQSTERLSRLLQKAIQSPLVIVYCVEDKIQVSTALKRLNRSDRSAVVVEEYYTGNWFDPSVPNPGQKAFLDAVHLESLPSLDYKEAYIHIHRQVYIERYAEVITQADGVDFEMLKQQIEQCLLVQHEVEQLTKQLNQRSTSLKEKVRLAGEIKKLKKE